MIHLEAHHIIPDSVAVSYHDYLDSPQFTTCKVQWATAQGNGTVTLYLPPGARIPALLDNASATTIIP